MAHSLSSTASDKHSNLWIPLPQQADSLFSLLKQNLPFAAFVIHLTSVCSRISLLTFHVDFLKQENDLRVNTDTLYTAINIQCIVINTVPWLFSLHAIHNDW